MQDNVFLSLALSCAWGASWCEAGDVTPVKPLKPRTSNAGRATLAPAPGDLRSTNTIKKAHRLPTRLPTRTARTAQRVIRAQSEAELEEFEEAPIMQVGANDVIPPPAATGQAAQPQSDAIQRLRDRSAKARWDELHQEWLRSRKNRQPPAEAEAQQPPAAEQTVEDAGSENSFEPAPASTEPKTISPSPISSDAATTGEGVTAPSVPAGRVFLQSQQKGLQSVEGETEAQTKEQLRLRLEAEEALKVPPPIRDPGAMPKISEIDPNPVDWQLPAGRPVPKLDADRYIELGKNAVYTPRAFPDFTYTFEATNVYSNPLYFEDPTLERYGHTCGHLQPVASTARFVGQLALLPYQVAMKPLKAKIYPLGWYGPGEYVPYRLYQLPLNGKAALAEAAVILGVGAATP